MVSGGEMRKMDKKQLKTMDFCGMVIKEDPDLPPDVIEARMPEPGSSDFETVFQRDWQRHFFMEVKDKKIVQYLSADCNKIVGNHTCQQTSLDTYCQSLQDSIEEYDVEKCKLMNLIGEILHEAQENPQRLIAFNSPLLGMLLLIYHAYTCDQEMHVNVKW